MVVVRLPNNVFENQSSDHANGSYINYPQIENDDFLFIFLAWQKTMKPSESSKSVSLIKKLSVS